MAMSSSANVSRKFVYQQKDKAQVELKDDAEILASLALQYQIYTNEWHWKTFGCQDAPDLDHGFFRTRQDGRMF